MNTITDPQVFAVMQRNHLCIFSTLGPDGAPQSALVGFSEDENGWLVIGTKNTTRKYRNVMNDERVSIVVGGWEERKTVQYHGIAHVATGEEEQKYQALHIAKHPVNAKFKGVPGEAYIVVEPTWVRFTDATASPWKVIEADIVEKDQA